MALTKRLRYEILRRDNHTCQSCGARPGDTELRIDHVIPVALGGADDPSNLQTLCEPCNSGKSATPPDAATVARVADDALRWSQAIKAAAEKMLVAHGAQAAVYADLERLWNASLYGRRRPLPAGWQRSIDSFLAAGLPLAVIHDAVGIALSRERQDAWRYLCGIGWAKVRELQEAAKAMLTESADPDSEDYDEDLDPQLAPGRESLAATILGSLAGGTADVEARIERARLWLDYEDYQAPRTKLIISAAESAIWEMYGDLRRLSSSVHDLVDAYHTDIAAGLRDEALAVVAGRDDGQDGVVQESRIVIEMVERLILQRAGEFLDALPPEQKAEWIEYAVAWYGPANPWDDTAELADEQKVKYAAQVARVIKSGRHYRSMCSSRGEHIEACPRPAKFRAYIAEIDCCAPGCENEHEGHRLCERHLEQLVDGTYTNSKGVHFTVRDFTELEADA